MNTGPLVSVILPTYNRRHFLPRAIRSVLAQSYRNFELIIARDGGCEVADIVRSFDDPRIIFLDRGENRGKCATLNEAINASGGEYICYLDDDDLYYPNRIEVLVSALENNPQYQAAYCDTYSTIYRKTEDGDYQVLSKNLEFSRDFDRAAQMSMNFILHHCLMHTRSILSRTGLYNENLRVMIDWDMARRISFYTDILHVRSITGEAWMPEGRGDRISDNNRRDETKYLEAVYTIRATRPPKPWDKFFDTTIIYIPQRAGKSFRSVLHRIWGLTCFPYKLIVCLDLEQASNFDTEMPNVRVAACEMSDNNIERLKKARNLAAGDLITVITGDYKPDGFLWLEKALYPAWKTDMSELVFELANSNPADFAAVFTPSQIDKVLACAQGTEFAHIIETAGLTMRKPLIAEYPMLYDNHMTAAKDAMALGKYRQAAGLFLEAAQRWDNRIYLETNAGRCLYLAGDYERAYKLLDKINAESPMPETLFMQGKISKNMGNTQAAIKLFEMAAAILEGDVKNVRIPSII